MHFSAFTTTLAFYLIVTSLASPIGNGNEKRASASVLTEQSYSDFQVSDGVGGNALAEVNAKFPVDLSALSSVSASDLAIISKAAQVSEDAETGTGGFNDAIDAAGGTDTTAGQALQVGKIKNKVLKLQTDVLRIMIETAQGDDGSASELAGQQAKLATNVALDEGSAGVVSTAVDFEGDD